MPNGCDISEYQGDLDASWFAQWDYVIIRAFNENGYPDQKFDQNWRRARGQTLRGVYGWPIAGGDNRAAGARLVSAGPDAEAGYWADVEHSGRGMASPAEVENYLRGIGDRPRGFYSNIGECPRSPFLDAEQWWMADYGPNDGQRHDPNEQPPRPSRGYVIHQFSSNPIDLNYSDTLEWTGASDVALDWNDFAWMQNNITGQGIDGKTNITNRMVLDAVLAIGSIAGPGGITADQVRAIVKEEINKTKLSS